jgi:hypothetical protein
MQPEKLGYVGDPKGLYDPKTGVLHFSTVQTLLDLGWECEDAWGRDLPVVIRILIHAGVMPRSKKEWDERRKYYLPE